MNKSLKSKQTRDKGQKNNVTVKRGKRLLRLKNRTPGKVRRMSKNIAGKLATHSYSPTINLDLVTLKSIPRKELLDCNIEAAFKLKEPLQIGIKGNLFGKSCHYYYTPEAKKFLLKNLSADKHINPDKIIPPIQSQSNCWFNAMFVTFFVSDKGRKFFHFLRQLMIEGKQQDGTAIPEKLQDGFALLNFGIDAALTGNEYAYKLNTNNIIHLLFKGIPKSYKLHEPYIVDVDNAGNPVLYYKSIIHYLNNSSIQMLFIRDVNSKWKDKVIESVTKLGHLPHIIILEVYEQMASEFNRKPVLFSVNNGKYQIDSTVVRDISKQHFCATITCEGKQMGYDGASFHRLVPMEWKHKLNSDVNWQFDGTKDSDGITPLEWNFTKSYQLLTYYRVK